MPILEIQFVGEIPKVPNLAQEVADAAGEILMAQKGGTWVKLSCLPANQYAESGGLEEGVSPVFCTILRRQLPSTEVLAEQVARLSLEISRLSQRPKEHIHILHLPEARGRMAFGGTLVR